MKRSSTSCQWNRIVILFVLSTILAISSTSNAQETWNLTFEETMFEHWGEITNLVRSEHIAVADIEDAGFVFLDYSTPSAPEQLGVVRNNGYLWDVHGRYILIEGSHELFLANYHDDMSLTVQEDYGAYSFDDVYFSGDHFIIEAHGYDEESRRISTLGIYNPESPHYPAGVLAEYGIMVCHTVLVDDTTSFIPVTDELWIYRGFPLEDDTRIIINSPAYDLEKIGDYLFAASVTEEGEPALRVWYLANIENPELAAELPIECDSFEMDMDGSNLYLTATTGDDLQIIQVSVASRRNPEILGTIDDRDNQFDFFTVADDVIVSGGYNDDGEQGLFSFESDPENDYPMVSEMYNSTPGIISITNGQTYSFASHRNDGFYALEYQDVSAPVIHSEIEIEEDLLDMQSAGSYLAGVSETSIYLYELDDNEIPQLLDIFELDFPAECLVHDLIVQENGWLLVNYMDLDLRYRAYVQLFRIHENRTIVQLPDRVGVQQAYDVVGNYALMFHFDQANTEYIAAFYNLTDPEEERIELFTYPSVPYWTSDIVAEYGYCYEFGTSIDPGTDPPHDYQGSISVYDIRDIHNPVWIQNVETDLHSPRVKIYGDYLIAYSNTPYYEDESHAQVWSIEDRENPVMIGSVTMEYTDGNGFTDVAMLGNDQFLILTDQYMMSYRVNNPLVVDDTGSRSTGMPTSFEITGVYPNPFNSSTMILFECNSPAPYTIRLYDILGRQVSTLVNEALQTGTHRVHFDGHGLSSGTYFLRLNAGNQSQVQRIMLVK